MLVDMEACDASRRVFGVVVAHDIFRGLVDIDGLDPQVPAPLEVVLKNARDLCDLTRRERVKRMVDRNTGSVQGNIFCFQGHLVIPLE